MSEARLEEIQRIQRAIERTTEYHEHQIKMLQQKAKELDEQHDALSAEARGLKVSE